MNLRSVQAHELAAGAAVVWLRTARGGYGYVTRVPARVVTVNPKTNWASIEITKRDGTPARRAVKVCNLFTQDSAP